MVIYGSKISSLLATTTQWSNNTIVSIILYSGDRLCKTKSEVPEWISEAIN
jgi:hypothetical protein